MPKFRKKPVEIEAQQTGPETAHDVLAWVRASGSKANFAAEGGLFISTLEGDMYASPGDWVIRGVQGEFYPCKPDIFEATYEPTPTADLASRRQRDRESEDGEGVRDE